MDLQLAKYHWTTARENKWNTYLEYDSIKSLIWHSSLDYGIFCNTGMKEVLFSDQMYWMYCLKSHRRQNRSEKYHLFMYLGNYNQKIYDSILIMYSWTISCNYNWLATFCYEIASLQLPLHKAFVFDLAPTLNTSKSF